MYRSSVDVRASYASILYNLGTVVPLHQKNLSYPGCWAYPDMLQVCFFILLYFLSFFLSCLLSF